MIVSFSTLRKLSQKGFRFLLAFAVLLFPLVHLHPESFHNHEGELAAHLHKGKIEFCFFDVDEEESNGQEHEYKEKSLDTYTPETSETEVALVAERSNDETGGKVLSESSFSLKRFRSFLCASGFHTSFHTLNFYKTTHSRAPPFLSFSV